MQTILTRDSNNKIPVAIDALRVELHTKYDKSSYDVVQRDNYLYNLEKISDVFVIKSAALINSNLEAKTVKTTTIIKAYINFV